MANEHIRQFIITSAGPPNPTANGGNHVSTVALYKADGTPYAIPTKQAAQADSVAATVGALVTDFNALLAKLRLAGILS
jgi:hypothetical protein